MISRALILRDRVFWKGLKEFAEDEAVVNERLTIASGANVLDAKFVRPAVGEPSEVVLICHGIGETVEHWRGAQQLLAQHGVASLVFNYSGYGKSTGRVEWEQCERDAVTAFAALRGLVGERPIALLGFSLGSGVAAEVVSRVDASRLILCAGFTSFRDAVCVLGLPRAFVGLVPSIWSAREALAGCCVPVTVVHGEKDVLFPVRMARELAGDCGAELIVVRGLRHNEPYRRPSWGCWGRVFGG